jgi:hypothetical protein
MTTKTKTKTALYTLRNTFVNCDLSRHKTLEAAVKAQAKHLRGTKRAHGQASYLTYEVLFNGEPLSADEREEYLDLCHSEGAR